MKINYEKYFWFEWVIVFGMIFGGLGVCILFLEWIQQFDKNLMYLVIPMVFVFVGGGVFGMAKWIWLADESFMERLEIEYQKKIEKEKDEFRKAGLIYPD